MRIALIQGSNWFLGSLLGLGLAACASGTPPAGAVNVPAVSAAARGPAPTPSLLPLSAPLPAPTREQSALADELREYVTTLVQVGERNSAHEWNLAVATDQLAERLEGMGYTVTRQGYMYNGVLAQNLIVQVGGSEASDELVLVGARYDSALGSPGADGNATGVAALLALAKRFYGTKPAHSLRFAFFSDAAAQASYEASGAVHYARLAHEERQKLTAVVELYGLGAYSTLADSQAYPSGMPVVRPTADFIELTAYPEYSAIAERLADGMKAASAVPVVTSLLLERSSVPPTAAHRAFLDYGYPAMMFSDTHQRRYSAFGGAEDVVQGIDFDRFSRVTLGLANGLLTLTGPLAVNPIVAP